MNPIPIILHNPRFHGSLLGMIGKTVKEVLAEAPGPARVNEGGRAQRLVWKERGTDSETEEDFPLYLMARTYDGKVWAVGIWAERFTFPVEREKGGVWFFRAVGKPKINFFRHVNWVVLEEGVYVNIGLGA